MDKEQRLTERIIKNCRSKKNIAETASKLADKTGEATQGEEDGRDKGS